MPDPLAASAVSPARTGAASISTKAITHGSVPRLIQLWMPDCAASDRHDAAKRPWIMRPVVFTAL